MKPRARVLLALLMLTLIPLAASTADAQHYFLERAPDGVILIYQDTSFGYALPGDSAGFPITISQPGSYRLASNIVVPDANTTAINITAGHVTLDLNGFAILGPTTCSTLPTVTTCSPIGVGHGVQALQTSTLVADVTIRNGTVSGMGSFGILVGGPGVRVERIHASNNGDSGIYAQDVGAILLYNTAVRNGGHGILTNTSVVLGNVTAGNRLGGVTAHSFLSPSNGAGHNIITNNGTNTLFATQTDGNVCQGALCP